MKSTTPTSHSRTNPKAGNNPALQGPNLDLAYRGSRCTKCYWGLYDGQFCQNPHCEMSGLPVGEHRVHLTNAEAMEAIKQKRNKTA